MPIRSPKEKPLYTITAANLQQYQGKLTTGQIEMLKRFPEYKMLVYPSHRTAALEQGEYDHIKAEAGKAALAEGGNGILNVKNSSVPFPMPKSGVEAIWNHMTRHRGGSFIRYTSLLPVQVNGAFTPVVRIEHIAMASKVKNAEPNRLMYYMRTDTAPSSQAGTALLDYEPLDQVKGAATRLDLQPGVASCHARAGCLLTIHRRSVPTGWRHKTISTASTARRTVLTGN
ncbi:DUF1329 domain-containing protein [Pseudoduganella sp. UC29_106]|uniref:DUF1329 domain-containing protein n=1 Tax=Pseudoduganella sp. UC29_106 TaxID=3374553 RepID=UPI003756FB68